MTSPMTWSTRTPEGEALVWVDNHISGRGGLHYGRPGGHRPLRLQPPTTIVEVTEASFPLRFKRFRLIPNSEGAGRISRRARRERLYELVPPTRCADLPLGPPHFATLGASRAAAGAELAGVSSSEALSASTLRLIFPARCRQGDVLHSVIHAAVAGAIPSTAIRQPCSRIFSTRRSTATAHAQSMGLR